MTPLRAWNFPEDAEATPLGTGLINQTYGVWSAGELRAVLQQPFVPLPVRSSLTAQSHSFHNTPAASVPLHRAVRP